MQGGCESLPAMKNENNDHSRVLAHAVDTIGSRESADTWLNRPNQRFANRTPLELLNDDAAAVEEELVRIDHGMFA